MTTFFNYSDENFTYPWNSKVYVFTAGEVYKDFLQSVDGTRIFLEDGITDHFARHLANREMEKAGNHPGRSDLFEEFRQRAKGTPTTIEIPQTVTVAPQELSSTGEQIEAEVEEKPKRGPGRPKASTQKDDADEFEK